MPVSYVNRKLLRAKVKFFPVHTTRAEVELHSFLSTALVGSEWLTSWCGRCTFGKKPTVAIE
jgi:hypothetical protein